MYPVPYRAAHILDLEVQASQMWAAALITDEQTEALEGPNSHTLMLDGAPLACCGAVELEPHRAMVWSFISARADSSLFRAMHTWAKKFLEGLPFKRLEAAVDVDFEAGHRWVRALGFVKEAERMRGYRLNGQDCALYALVR